MGQSAGAHSALCMLAMPEIRKKIAKRLDPTRPHEQELRRYATTIGQALAEAGGLISKNPKENHHD